MSSPSPVRSAYAAWSAVCLLWGTTYLAIRIALESIPPMLLGGLRFAAAGALMLAWFAARGERMPRHREWPGLALLGVLLIALGNGGVVWAERTVPSGLTAVLVASIPFWMIGVERFASSDHEGLPPGRVIGLLVGFAGIAVLVWPELRVSDGNGFVIGVVATQVACLGWAVGSSYSRRRSHGESVLVTAAAQMLTGGVAMLTAGTLRGEWSQLALTSRTGAAFAYLVLFGSIVGFSAYAYALKHLPVSTVSLYAYVNPVIAVALGTVVLGEPFSPRLAVAGCVVLIGIALVRR